MSSNLTHKLSEEYGLAVKPRRARVLEQCRLPFETPSRRPALELAALGQEGISLGSWVGVESLEESPIHEEVLLRLPHEEAQLLRLGWHLRPGMGFSPVGQNLTKANHFEFGNQFSAMATPVPRTFYGKLTFNY